MTVALTKNFLPLCILAVLHAHGNAGTEQDEDGNCYLTQTQIRNLVEADYGLAVSDRSVVRNIRSLLTLSEAYDWGFHLEFLATDRRATGEAAKHTKELVVHTGWRMVKDSGFETSEIRMLIDSVIASPMIRPRQRDELVERLSRLAPFDVAVPDIFRVGHLPAVNDDFFLNLELLNEAIECQHYVRLTLGYFDTKGKLCETLPHCEKRRYEVAPVQLLVSKGHCYFLAHFAGDEEIYKFRVELMMNVELTDIPVAEEDRLPEVDVLKYREQHSYMMSGEVLNITLRVSNDHLYAVFDQFGPNVTFFNQQDETVDVKFKSAKYSVLFWALQYYRYVEVVAPQPLREELAHAGRCIAQMYAGEPGAVSLAERLPPA